MVLLTFAALWMAWAADVLAELGLKEDQARQNVIYALDTGSVPLYPAVKAFKAAPATARAALARGALMWAKAYTESEEFARAYSRVREERKPDDSRTKVDIEAELAKEDAENRKNLEESKKNAASMPPDLRKQIEEGLKVMEAMLNDPETAKLRRQGREMELAEAKKDYERAMKEWQANYPADPRPVVARRLRAFLDLSATVDFSAKTVQRDGRLVFADPKHESRSSNWKLCYRAGPETVEAARTFAEAWLAELGK